MERARDDEDYSRTSQSMPPAGKSGQRLTTEPPMAGDPWPEPSDLEELEAQPVLEYLTLELDVSDMPVFAAEAPALEVPEPLAPEDLSSPGYLTLEIDLNAPEDESRG